MSWVKESDKNKGSTFRLIPVENQEKEPFYFIDLVNEGMQSPRMIMDEKLKLPIIVEIGHDGYR